MSDDMTPADQKIIGILNKLQETLGDDFSKLETGEVEAIRDILKHGDTLVEIAKYEEAKGLLWAHYRSLVLGIGAVLSALLAIWTYIEGGIGKVLKVFY